MQGLNPFSVTNKNIATAEKSPIFTSHKSYTKPLAFMRTENLVNKKLSEFKTKKIKIFADFEN